MKKTLLVAMLLCITALYGCKKEGTLQEGGENAQGKITVQDIPVIDSIEYVKIKEANKGKIVVMNFFASWCPPCNAEAPDFVKVYNEYKDKNFIIIGISTDDDKAAAAKFANKYGIEYPVYLSDRAIEKKYMVSRLPTTYIYDKEGKLMDIANGAIGGAYLKKLAESGAE